MKNILFIIILTILTITESFAENDKSESLARQKFNEISNYIVEKDYSKLWESCNSDYKDEITQQDFKIVTESVFKCIADNQVSDFSKLYKSTYNQSKLINEIWVKKKGTSYVIIPQYFGDLTTKLLHKIVGHELTIEIIEIDGIWSLNKLTFESNYTDKSFDAKKYVTDFFTEANLYDINFKVVSNTDQNNGKKQLKKEELEIFESLKNIEYIGINDVKFINVNDKAYGFYITKEKSKNLSDVDRFKLAVSKPVKTILEIIFCDESNLLLIGNGDKYAFYQIDNKELIDNYVDFIQDRLLTID